MIKSLFQCLSLYGSVLKEACWVQVLSPNGGIQEAQRVAMILYCLSPEDGQRKDVDLWKLVSARH